MTVPKACNNRFLRKAGGKAGRESNPHKRSSYGTFLFPIPGTGLYAPPGIFPPYSNAKTFQTGQPTTERAFSIRVFMDNRLTTPNNPAQSSPRRGQSRDRV